LSTAIHGFFIYNPDVRKCSGPLVAQRLVTANCGVVGLPDIPMRIRRKSEYRGFTLVELLVVIGVLAVLLALLLPVLGRARQASRQVVCSSNLRSLGLGMQMYSNDFKGALPWEGYAEGDRPIRHVGPWVEPSQWFNAAPSYCGYPPYCQQQDDDAAGIAPLPKDGGEQSLFVCPESGPASPGPKDDLVQDGYLMLWGMNADSTHTERRKTFWCYGYNTQLDGHVEDRHSTERVTLYRSSFSHASEIPLLIEKLMRPKEFDPPFPSGVGQAEVSWKEFTTRHNGGGMILFLDGHVSYFKRSEIINAPHAPDDFNQPNTIIWNPNGVAN
jgi:prepilin-type processing-associated H-X9-DG protein/prepilin-type N-terminal cleavage/methylation domain-containing protein